MYYVFDCNISLKNKFKKKKKTNLENINPL